MAQQKINSVNLKKHQISLFLVGLLWLALAAFAQAADTPGRAGMAARPTNGTSAAATSVGSDLLLYNPSNGSTTYGTLYADGHFLTSEYYPPNTWARGWSHIVRANGILFFYRQSDGFWATSRASQSGYAITLRSGYTGIAQPSSGFVHVVSTPNGILICRGSLERFTPPPGGGIVGQVGSDGSFRVTYSGRFAIWAKVLNTPNGLVFWKSEGTTGAVAVGRIQPDGAFLQTYGGTLEGEWAETEVIALGNDLILFPYARRYIAVLDYPRLSGWHRVAGISSTGQFVLRNQQCSPILAGGYLIPVVLGNDLLLYATEDTPTDYSEINYTRLVQSGWAMVATFGGSGYFYPDPSCRGKLIIKQEYPEGSLAAGWSKIVTTANGVFFHNPNTGAVMVGRFDVGGNFTQTQSIGNWLVPGYTMVVKVTD